MKQRDPINTFMYLLKIINVIELYPIDERLNFLFKSYNKYIWLNIIFCISTVIVVHQVILVPYESGLNPTGNWFDSFSSSIQVFIYYFNISSILLVNSIRVKNIAKSLMIIKSVKNYLQITSNGLLLSFQFRFVYLGILALSILQYSITWVNRLPQDLLYLLYNLNVLWRMYTSFETINLIYDCLSFYLNVIRRKLSVVGCARRTDVGLLSCLVELYRFQERTRYNFGLQTASLILLTFQNCLWIAYLHYVSRLISFEYDFARETSFFVLHCDVLLTLIVVGHNIKKQVYFLELKNIDIIN